MKRHIRENPIPLLISPLKGKEDINHPPTQGEGRGGGGGDPNREQLRILLRKRKTLSADSKVCSGCRTCEVICSLNHEGAVDPERSRIRLRSNPFKGSFIPMVCHQCADAACRAACPEGAIEIEDATGIVSIREERCTGCRSCEKACPFDALGFDSDRKKAFKCDLCRGDPACVAWCPMNALGVTEFGGTVPG